MSAPRFDAKTVVADAIAAAPDTVERLASLHSAFRKLRNPILRRTMARLVTLGDAARIAGLPVATVVAAANGEAAPPPDEAAESTSRAPEPAPSWVAILDLAAATRLDVRPMFERGEAPLGDIMRAAAAIAEGGTLIVEAPFDPAPLHRALARKGFVSHAEPVAPDHWRVYFHRTAAAETADAQPEDETAEHEAWRESDGVHIDVRGLEPPQPMMAILKLLEDPETGDVVIVHHEREPLFLYPELAERGWDHAIIPAAEGEVRLRLTRQTP